MFLLAQSSQAIYQVHQSPQTVEGNERHGWLHFPSLHTPDRRKSDNIFILHTQERAHAHTHTCADTLYLRKLACLAYLLSDLFRSERPQQSTGTHIWVSECLCFPIFTWPERKKTKIPKGQAGSCQILCDRSILPSWRSFNNSVCLLVKPRNDKKKDLLCVCRRCWLHRSSESRW